MEWCPPQKICRPGTCKCDLIWNRCFADVVELRIWWWDHPGWTGWARSPKAHLSIRDREEEIYRGEGHEETEAEIVVMLLQAKEHQGFLTAPEAGRELGNGFSLRAHRRSQFCQHLEFGLLVSRLVRKIIAVVLKPPNLGNLLSEESRIVGSKQNRNKP